jgi:hypothetical protein
MDRLAVLLVFLAIPAAAQPNGVALHVVPQIDQQYYSGFHERFHAYVFRTYTDPARISWLLLDSAEDHWSGAPRQWDRSAESYSFRIASAWGRRIVSNTAQLGFETILHEDSRYRRLGEGPFGTRILFALRHSVLAYKPDGSVEPMYGRMAAGVVAAAASSTWHPQSIGAGTLLCGLGQSAMDRSAGNLLTEFEPDLRRFGRKTWSTLRRK